MTESQFRTAFRGYDPADVDPVMTRLRKSVAESNEEVGRVNVALADARSELESLRARHAETEQRVAALTEQLDTAGRPSYAELGATVGKILTLAEEEAAGLKGAATAEAERVTSEARAAADDLASQARRDADELGSSSKAEAARILEDAKRKADDIIDHADRESSARREEAEAVYEHARQRATEAAADFEQTLAGRRGEATRDFEALLATHQAQLAESTARRDAAEAEATQLLEDAQRKSRALLDAAQAEATGLVSSARATADRVRSDSERELAAAAQRRDSITAQLSNVRQMLATLGQGHVQPDPVNVASPAPLDQTSDGGDPAEDDAEDHAQDDAEEPTPKVPSPSA